MITGLRDDRSDQIGSAWKNFDTVVAQLKSLSSSKRTTLKTQDCSLSRSRPSVTKRNVTGSRTVRAGHHSENSSELREAMGTESDSEPMVDSNVLSSSPCSVQSSHMSPSPCRLPPVVKRRASSMHELSPVHDAFTGHSSTNRARSVSTERLRHRQVISMTNSKSSAQSSPSQSSPIPFTKPSRHTQSAALNKGPNEFSISSTTPSTSTEASYEKISSATAVQFKLPGQEIPASDLVNRVQGMFVQM